jgi:hypothetical protein
VAVSHCCQLRLGVPQLLPRVVKLALRQAALACVYLQRLW